MKREYKKPLTEIVYLNTAQFFQDDFIQDSEGVVKGSDPNILGNEGMFEEEEGFGSPKSLWD